MITVIDNEFLSKLADKDFEGPYKVPLNVVKKFRQRIISIQAASSENDLRKIGSLHFEKLLEKRYKGKYSIRVTDGWRMILSLEKGKVTIVHIEQLTDHYN